MVILFLASRSSFDKRLRSQNDGSGRNGGEGIETMRGWHTFLVQLLGYPSVVCGGVYDIVPSAPKFPRAIGRNFNTHHIQGRFGFFAIDFIPLRDGWFQETLITQLRWRRNMVLSVPL